MVWIHEKCLKGQEMRMEVQGTRKSGSLKRCMDCMIKDMGDKDIKNKQYKTEHSGGGLYISDLMNERTWDNNAEKKKENFLDIP